MKTHIKVYILAFFISAAPCFANDIDHPDPLTPTQQIDLNRFGFLQTEETGRESVGIGALIGLGTDVLYNFMTSQVLSRMGWHWLAVHCSDCRPTTIRETLRRIAVDAPGFIGMGAAFGACNASGYLAQTICRGTIDTALNLAIQSAMSVVDRDLRPDSHVADHIAGNALLAILWNPLFPRGVVMFEGRSTEALVGNGVVEVLGEGLRGGVNSILVNSASRLLRNEPLQIRESFARGFLSNGIEHLVAVALAGPRMRFSDRDEQRILTYTRARVGLDNTEALRHTDFRLSWHSAFGGSDFANTFMNQTVLFPGSVRVGESEFLITAAHEVGHVRQNATRSFFGITRLRLQHIDDLQLDRPLERIPEVISNDGRPR